MAGSLCFGFVAAGRDCVTVGLGTDRVLDRDERWGGLVDGDGDADGPVAGVEAVADAVAEPPGMAVGSVPAAGPAEVLAVRSVPSRTVAPTVPATSNATATTPMATRPADDLNVRTRACFAVTGPSFPR